MLCQQRAKPALCPCVWCEEHLPPLQLALCARKGMGLLLLALVSKLIVVHKKNISLLKLVDIYLQEAYVLFLKSPHFTF